MAIASTDMKVYLSGGGSNTDPDLSLGGAISSTLAGTDLFDDVSASEASAGDTEYRAVYVKNTNSTDSAYVTKIWVQTNTPSSSSAVTIALAGEGASATIETVTDESTAPSGESFSTAENEAAALSIGTLAPGAYYGVWIKRVITAAASSYANDTFTLRVKADTTT